MPPTSKKAEADLAAVLAKIDSWPAPYAEIGRRLHELFLETAPDLKARTWFGGCGYAVSGPVVVFHRVDDGVMSLGITEKAPVVTDQDRLMSSAWYVTGLDGATEARIAEIVKRAVG
jgi:hypothetical protein